MFEETGTYIFETTGGNRLNKSWRVSWNAASKKAKRLSRDNGYITVFFYKESEPDRVWDNYSDDRVESDM